MKELYISPELELLCFAPTESLAVDASDLILGEGLIPDVDSEDQDFSFDFDVFE